MTQASAMQIDDKMVEAARNVPRGHYINADEWMRAVLTAGLTAALAEREPVAVAVKPLEWVEDPNYPGHDGHAVASVFGHTYKISRIWNGSKQRWCWWLTGTVASNDWYDTLDAAKDAAQADYEQRIRSALVATPPAERVLDGSETMKAFQAWWEDSGREDQYDHIARQAAYAAWSAALAAKDGRS